MNQMRSVLPGFFLVLSSSAAFVAAPAEMPQEPVAIVCVLSGDTFATFDNKRSGLRLFQRLRPGTMVEADARAKVVVAFFTGDRYEFGEQSSASVGRTGLERQKGTIRELTPVPALIEIAPIAREETPGTRLAGMRIRTGDAATEGAFSNLYPSAGAVTVAQTTVVRFDPVDGYQKYRVELEDAKGNAVFSVETAATMVQIARDVLRPGASYYWRVRTLDVEKPAIRGEAVFSTLSEDHARRRAALEAYVDDTGDRSLLGLLAELDHSLGLQREACEGLKAALDASPDSRQIADVQARFECSKR